MKRSIIGLLLGVLALAFVPSLGGAADCGKDGSPANHAGSCENADNELTCGEDATATPLGAVSVGAGGIEVCNDGSGAAPIQGRVGGDAECQCIYADGTSANSSPANGWAKLDANGLACGGDSTSYNGDDPGSPDNCG